MSSMKSTIFPTFSPAGLRTSAVDRQFAVIGRIELSRGLGGSFVASHIPTAPRSASARALADGAQSLEFRRRNCSGRRPVAQHLARSRQGRGSMRGSIAIMASNTVGALRRVARGGLRRVGAFDGGRRHGHATPSPARTESRSLIPVVDIAPAVGWSNGGAPRRGRRARGRRRSRAISIIRAGCTCCRTATCSSPKRTRRSARALARASRALVMARAMKKAGSATPSADRITLLRDSDGDGEPELRTTFVADLHSPFGMALVGDDFYVANTDALLRFDYRATRRAGRRPATRVAELPAGEINYHWTKNVIASRDGTRLYVTVGLEQQRRRARARAGAPTRGDSRDRPARRARRPSTRRACAIRTVSRGSRRAGRCGPSSTSATRSAAISCRTI